VVTTSVSSGDSTGKYRVDRRLLQRIEAERRARENAVYAHIQAVRAMGRASVNSREIAVALGLPIPDVEEAMKALQARGVRLLP
jgi:hypothetical protein